MKQLNSNPTLLTLDTATEYCSVALVVGGRVYERAEHCKNQHSAKLFEMIDEVLKEAGIKINDLDAIGFGCGPGSFTGVRIAMSVAQGLAYGISKPVIPISTLQITAQQAYAQYGVKRAHVALDARMQQIYYGCFELDKNALMQPVGEMALLFPREVNISGGYGVGNGWAVYAGEFDHTLKVEGIYPDTMPIARAAIVLAQSAFLQGRVEDPDKVVPIYLRDHVAEKN